MKVAAKLPAVQKPAKPIRICARAGCGKVLLPSAKKFCTRECKHIYFHGALQDEFISKYNPEYATTKLDEFFEYCHKGSEPNLVPTENSYIVINQAILPTISLYAEYLKVNVTTLDNWQIKYPEFSRAMGRLIEVQKTFLINHGLSGRYSPVIAKMILSVNHGMVEKKYVDMTHKHIGIVKHLYEKADQIEREKLGLL